MKPTVKLRTRETIFRPAKARRKCRTCGRRIVVYFPARRGYGVAADHDLCQRCWRAERDRARVPR